MQRNRAVIAFLFRQYRDGRSGLSVATADLITRLRAEDPGLHDSGTQKSV